MATVLAVKLFLRAVVGAAVLVLAPLWLLPASPPAGACACDAGQIAENRFVTARVEAPSAVLPAAEGTDAELGDDEGNRISIPWVVGSTVVVLVVIFGAGVLVDRRFRAQRPHR